MKVKDCIFVNAANRAVKKFSLDRVQQKKKTMKQVWDHTYWGFFLAYFELKTLKKKMTFKLQGQR